MGGSVPFTAFALANLTFWFDLQTSQFDLLIPFHNLLIKEIREITLLFYHWKKKV